MKLIRHKDAAGRLPEKENRKGSLRGILGLTLLLTLGVVLAAGGLGTRASAAPGGIELPGIEEGEKLVTSSPSPGNTSEQEEQKKESYDLGEGQTGGRDSGFAVILNEGEALDGDEGSRLEPFVSGAKLTQDGVEVEEDGMVVVGEHYEYHVEFSEDVADGEFTSPMYFQLPDNIQCKPVKDQKIFSKDWKEGKEPAGYYSVDENGMVTVTFVEAYLEENTNLSMGLDFDLVVGEGSEESVEFPWGRNGETKTFTVDTNPDATLEKTRAGDYNPNDPEGPSIQYQVELEITKGMVLNPELKDVMQPGLSYRDGSGKITVTNEKGEDVTGEMNPPLTLEKTENGWKVKDMPESLSKGWKITVDYTADVDSSKVKGGVVSGKDFNFTAENEAVFDGKEPTSGEDKPFHRDDNEKYPISDERLDKSGSAVEGEKQINWEIVVGSGSTDVRGSVVSDKLEGNHWIDENEPLQLKWKDENGSNIHEFKIPWTDPNLTIYRDENDHITSFEYKIPEPDDKDSKNPFWKQTKDGQTYEWGPGHTIKLEYYTTYDEPDPDKPFENTATVEADKGKYEDTGTVGVGAGTISKDGQLSADGEYMEYTVNLSIPSAADLAVATGGYPGDNPNNPSRFYISDELEFDDVTLEDEKGKRTVRYFVENIPEDVTITVTPKGGEPIKFTQVTNGIPGENEFQVALGGKDFQVDGEDPDKKTIREFRIWFNRNLGGSTLDDGDTYWVLDKPCTITMTYKVKTSAKVYLEDEQYSGNISVSDLTLKDLLNQGFTLKNQAVGHGRDKNSFKATHTYKGSLPEFDVQKDGKILETDPEHPFNNEIEYRVQFNGFTTDVSTGKYGKTKIDPDNFFLEDVFDSRLEYVKGSLQVEVYAPDSHRHRYTFQYVDDPKTETTDTGTKLTAEAAGFSERTYQGTSGDNEETLWDYMKSKSNGPRELDALYVFIYKLRVREEYIDGQALELKNEATVHYEGKTSGDDATVNFTPQFLIKDGKHELDDQGFDIMRYTVEVNPGAADMVTTEREDLNPDRFTLTDEMDEILIFRMDTVKVYAVGEDGTKEELTRVADQSLVKPGNKNFVLQMVSSNAFKLILPDQTHLRIEYDTDIDADHGASGSVSNTIKMEGGMEISDTNNAQFNMNSTNAWIKGDATMRLFKKDASTGNYLNGAEFQLYAPTKDGESGDVEAKIGGTQYSFKEYQSLAPDDFKGAEIGPENGNKEGYYLLLETKAPSGFQRCTDPFLVVFKEKGDGDPETIAVVYEGKEYPEVEVHYIARGDNVVIIEDQREEYKLPETGGSSPLYLYLLGSVFILAGGLALLYDRRLARERVGR